MQGCIQILRVWIGLVLEICYRIGTSSLLSGLWSSTTNYTTWHTVTIITLLLMMSASMLMLMLMLMLVLVVSAMVTHKVW